MDGLELSLGGRLFLRAKVHTIMVLVVVAERTAYCNIKPSVSKIFAAFVVADGYGDGVEAVVLLPARVLEQQHFGLGLLVVLALEGREVGCLAGHAGLEVLSGGDGEHFALPGVADDAVDLEALVGGAFVGVLLVAEDDFLALLLLVDHFLGHAVEFGEVDHAFAVGEVGDVPLALLLVPVRVVQDVLQLVGVHQDVHDRGELLDLLLLVADRVQQFLLLVLVLVLQVLQLDQVGGVLLLDLLEPLPHFVHLLVEVLVVLLDAEEFLLAALLLAAVLLLLLLLLLQLLLHLLDLLQLALLLAVRPLLVEVPLQVLQFLPEQLLLLLLVAQQTLLVAQLLLQEFVLLVVALLALLVDDAFLVDDFGGGDGGGGGHHGERHLALQHHLQLLDLLHVLAQQCVLGVLVDLGLVLDELGAAGVPQRAQGLVVVVVGGRAGRDHDGLGVAAQGVLQQAGEFGVAVGDVVGLAVDEGGDDVAEGAEGEVDLGGLLESLAGGAGLAGAFGAGEVDEVEFGGLVLVVALVVVLLGVEVDGEDGVGAGGLGVHVGGADGAVLEAEVHVLLHLADGVDLDLREVLHEDALLRTLLQLHLRLDVLPQQVVDLLVVDFDEAAPDQVRLRGLVLGDRDDLAEGARDDAAGLLAVGTAHHGVRLAAAGLSVGEDGAVVAVEHALHEGEGALLVDEALGGVGGEDAVEGEALGLLLHVLPDQVDLVVLRVHLHDAHAA